MPRRRRADADPTPTVRVGADVVEVARIRRLLRDQPEIAATIYTDAELAYCARRGRGEQHLAGRFAAKEAVLKAFETGLGKRMRWTDVEIVNERRGKPRVRLHGEVAEFARRRGLIEVDVSLAHTRSLAMAQVVAVWRDPPGNSGTPSYADRPDPAEE